MNDLEVPAQLDTASSSSSSSSSSNSTILENDNEKGTQPKKQARGAAEDVQQRTLDKLSPPEEPEFVDESAEDAVGIYHNHGNEGTDDDETETDSDDDTSYDVTVPMPIQAGVLKVVSGKKMPTGKPVAVGSASSGPARVSEVPPRPSQGSSCQERYKNLTQAARNSLNKNMETIAVAANNVPQIMDRNDEPEEESVASNKSFKSAQEDVVEPLEPSDNEGEEADPLAAWKSSVDETYNAALYTVAGAKSGSLPLLLKKPVQNRPLWRTWLPERISEEKHEIDDGEESDDYYEDLIPLDLDETLKEAVEDKADTESKHSKSDSGHFAFQSKALNVELGPFKVKPEDVYQKPKQGQLISYLFHKTPVEVYRVAILKSSAAKGRLAFYNDENDIFTASFHLTKKSFEDNMFRVRHDLSEGARCFDTQRKSWCKLERIHRSNGSVLVQYLDKSKSFLWISPDYLVGSSDPIDRKEDKENGKNDSHSVAQLNALIPTFIVAHDDGIPGTSSYEESDAETQDIPTQSQLVSTYDESSDVETGEVGENCNIRTQSQAVSTIDENTDNETTEDEEKDGPGDMDSTMFPNFGLDQWEPNPSDAFQQPQKGQLVSYMWTKDPVASYRVGVLTSKASHGSIRFYNGEGSISAYRFELTKSWFRKGFFRVRNDLSEGRHCFDTDKSCWCTLKEIDRTDGSVLVKYSNSTKDDWMSPDALVGYMGCPKDGDDDGSEDASQQSFPQDDSSQALGVIDDEVPAQKKRKNSFDSSQSEEEEVEGEESPSEAEAEGEGDHGIDSSAIENIKEGSIIWVEDGKTMHLATVRNVTDIGDEMTSVRSNVKNLLIEWSDGKKVWIRTDERKVRTEHPPRRRSPPSHDIKRQRLEKQTTSQRRNISVSKPRDFLLVSWRNANRAERGYDYASEMEIQFRKRVDRRSDIRLRAQPNWEFGQFLDKEAAETLEAQAFQLQTSLKEYFYKDSSLMGSADLQHRIQEIKYMSTHMNLLLLCGGIAPEVTALKRLRVPIGVVVLQDVDLGAVGTAVAAHPDIHFAIVADDSSKNRKKAGDVEILRDLHRIRQLEVETGGIHSVHMTNPCGSFSRTGQLSRKHGHKILGFKTPNGQLFHDCKTALDNFERFSGEKPLFLAENVVTIPDYIQKFGEHLGVNYFQACGSWCAPSLRERIWGTNRPPPCDGHSAGPAVRKSPSLNGALSKYSPQCVPDNPERFQVPSGMAKFDTLLHSKSKPAGFGGRNVLKDKDSGIERPFTGREAERAMGYREGELDVTRYSAKVAVRKRIQEHNVETEGILISLKGCADDASAELIENTDEERRKYLGNSQTVTMLEALLWNDQKLFPDISKN